MVDNNPADDQKEQDKKDKELLIKLLHNSAQLLVVVTAICLFISLTFNAGYFWFIDYKLITLLSFKDYFESSLPLIFTAVLFAWGGYSYFQMADHQLIETSKPLIKLIQSGLKILKKPKKLIFLPFLAILPVLFTFALLLLFLARFGHYILLGVFTLATSEGLEKAYYLDVDQVKLFFLIVFLSVIVVDLFLFFRPHKFHLRKIIIRMLAFCISVSLICGTQTLIHDLSRKPSRLYVNENNETKKIFFMRGIERGLIYFDIDDSSVKFSSWDNFKEIGFSDHMHGVQ